MQAPSQFRPKVSYYDQRVALHMVLDNFDPNESRNLGTKRYRTPPYQRFDSWSIKTKQNLIDTVLQYAPLPVFFVTSHAEVSAGGNIQQYFNIQDGQTRLSTLYNFMQNKFQAEDRRFFNDLSDEERARFRNYPIMLIISEKNPEISDREFEEILAERFERVNSGKSLSDNDKFHARLGTPVMRLVTSLRSSPEFGMLLKKYCWSKLGMGTTRPGLKEMAAIIMSVINKDSNFITTSYSLNGQRMVTTEVGAEDIERVSSFLRWYFDSIELAIPNVAKPKSAIFNKIPSILGMMLFDWIEHPGATRDAMWISFIKETHDHKNFSKTLFASLNDGDRRCATIGAFNAKFTAVVRAFTPTHSFEHVIAQITGVAAESPDTGSDTEDES
jgi:Protein of unknown function DUF262